MIQASSTHILDASALLALLQQEPGSDSVRSVLPTAAMSSVNWSEVLQKSLARGVDIGVLTSRLSASRLTVFPFNAEDADRTARLLLMTRALGLSLGDRACLALGMRLGLPVLTADRSWSQLQLPIEVRLIR